MPICTTCQGSGRDTRINSSMLPEDGDMPCTTCGGSGSIREPFKVKIPRDRKTRKRGLDLDSATQGTTIHEKFDVFVAMVIAFGCAYGAFVLAEDAAMESSWIWGLSITVYVVTVVLLGGPLRWIVKLVGNTAVVAFAALIVYLLIRHFATGTA